MFKIVWPWKVEGRFADGYETIANGFNENDCMSRLFDMMEEHGELIWYSGYEDEDYVAGEYVGKENFYN